MPRPKRRVSASKNAPAPAAQASHRSSDSHEIGDGEKGRSRATRNSKGTAAPEASRKSALANPTPSQAAALRASRQRRDSAMQRLENMTSTTNTGNTTNSADDSPEDNDEDSVEVEVGRKAAATPKHGRLAEMSGLDLDDSMFDDLNTTFNTAGPASAQRSNENSTLSATHFRRRPRAGSFLSRDDGPLRPSSRAGPNTPAYSSTFNIGMFKRRAREPSILGTAQKERPQRPEVEADSSDKSDEEDEDEAEADGFGPEAESTPLRRSKRRSGAAEAEEMLPPTSTSVNSVNTRKRKSTEGHEQRLRSSSYAGSDQIVPPDMSSSPLSLPRHISIPTTPLRDADEDEDIPPPESSGSEESEAEIWPPIQSLAKGRSTRTASALRRTPVPDDNPSDMSSPPSLTYSPNCPEPSPPPRAARQTRKAASKKEVKLTTADLRGLLPRRRQRNARADPFSLDESDDEVDISGLGNDDDELSHLDVRARRRPLSGANKKNQSEPRGPRGSSGQRKGKQTPGSAKPTVRTYGRSSDKENEDGDGEGDSLGPAPDDDGTENSEEMARMGEELKNASKKFKEVDKWELEYEEVSETSSQHDAR